MARYTGPKNKLSRREGVDLFNKGVKLRRLTIAPGVHGPKMRQKKLSDYAAQLREKQKVRRIYGVLERQFRNYVKQAERSQLSTGESIMQILEGRLDNVLYRAGVCKTRNMARQIVVHGHVKVDGVKVDRPSFQILPSQTITLSEKILANPDIITQMQSEDNEIPEYIDRKSGVIQLNRKPNLDEIVEGVNLPLIVEYYSR